MEFFLLPSKKCLCFLAIYPSKHFVIPSACLTLTKLAVFSYIRGRAVAFEISIQVSAGTAILTWLSSAVIYIYREINHSQCCYRTGQLQVRLKADYG